jgi:putative methyltransferase (TIGR04325 family)
VPTVHDGYDNELRIAEFVDETKGAMSTLASGGFPASYWHDPLGYLAAVAGAGRDRLQVLDFGGGVGQAFVHLISTWRGRAAVVYHVVDLEGMCAAGRMLFANDSRITFHTRLPDLTGGIDIVYASAVLPYMDDYAATLRDLAALGAPYVLLTRLAAGAFPTYAARQLNLTGQQLGYWFLNVQEIVDVMAASGYLLVHEGQSGPDYLQSNYPPSHRIGRMRNMLFVGNSLPLGRETSVRD